MYIIKNIDNTFFFCIFNNRLSKIVIIKSYLKPKNDKNLASKSASGVLSSCIKFELTERDTKICMKTYKNIRNIR